MTASRKIEEYRKSDNESIRNAMEIRDRVLQLPLEDQKMILGVIKGIEMCVGVSQKGA